MVRTQSVFLPSGGHASACEEIVALTTNWALLHTRVRRLTGKRRIPGLATNRFSEGSLPLGIYLDCMTER